MQDANVSKKLFIKFSEHSLFVNIFNYICRIQNFNPMSDFRILADAKYSEIFTEELSNFITELHRKFDGRRLELLGAREEKQKEFDAGKKPTFLPETESIRSGDWKCAPVPENLQDRRVEITGPVDRKMIINALNSGASCFMADFEDSNSPTWENCMEGQKNLSDAVAKTISFENEKGKKYELSEKTATLLVRPRGLHLNEKHIEIDGKIASGSLVDFGIYFFRNAKKAIEDGGGIYFYLPKLEHYAEAQWWNDVFVFAQDYLGVPQGSIKATVLIETITAAFQMNEILHALKEHSAGLNCGRWDYIFSYIKKFRNQPEFIVPDRSQVTMTAPFMSAYSRLVVQTCHKRGVHAMGGMAAQIPVKGDDAANDAAFAKVRADKEREANNGHDGTWVAHPALVQVAMEVFNDKMPEKNQIDRPISQEEITEEQLLEIPQGTITEKGVRENINVGILYIESWLMGAGAAAIYNLMEDAATAEISRTQVWQWLKNNAKLDDGRILSPEIVKEWENEELEKIKDYVGESRFENGRFQLATELFNELVLDDDFEEFLTTKAYQYI